MSARLFSRVDGRLVFVSLDNTLYATTITANGDVPQPSKPERLFTLAPSDAAWAPSPTDDRFLVSWKSDPLDQLSVLHYLRKEW